MSDKREHDHVEHAGAGKLGYHISEHADSEKHHGIDPNSFMLRTTTLMVVLACYIGIGGFISSLTSATRATSSSCRPSTNPLARAPLSKEWKCASSRPLSSPFHRQSISSS